MRTWIVAGAVAALLAAAGTAVAGDREGHRRRGGKHRRQAIHRTLQRVEALTDDQARTAYEAARDLGRMRAEMRAKKAALLLRARRDKVRPDFRALREEFKGPFTEAGMKVVKSLTPEQRAAIAKRRPAVTDERLARFFGMRLSRPWAEAILKARLDGGATAPAK